MTREIERDHRQRRIERDRRRPIEQPGQVTGRRGGAAHGRQACRPRPTCRRHPCSGRGCDQRPSAGSARRSPHRLSQGDVDRGVLQRRQAPREHGLARAPIRSRRRAATVEAHCSSERPLGRWPSSSGFRRVLRPWPRTMAASADGVGDGGVFALRVAGHVHAPPERQRPRVEGLRQR